MKRALVYLLVVFCLPRVEANVQLEPTKSFLQGATCDWKISRLPEVSNPFDSSNAIVAIEFKSPSGKPILANAFWYQEYTNRLVNGSESLTAVGLPHWRVRFRAEESGLYNLKLHGELNGTNIDFITNFTALASANPVPPRVNIGTNNRYFALGTNALVLNGANVCWPGGRGLFDYKDWFPAMKNAGENFARIWMCPWAFGIETDPNSLVHYRLDRAWQLDQLFELAEENGIYLMLCLDYHGMFQTQPDSWGGNNNWKINPYNQANGGPCTQPDDFFTNAAAARLYQNRLRYLVARYGSNQKLLAWEFLNEIDNVYNLLNATDVANWHGTMGTWLHANDPWQHLVTTSLTGLSDRPEIWSLPQMDFAMYHSYNLAAPAAKLPGILNGMWARYQKPVMLGEYGIDFRGWQRTDDPYLRGFRQGVWGGLLGGSTGTGMSWWWENLHSENVYPYYSAIRKFLGKSKLGENSWAPVQFVTSGEPPATVGDLISNAPPFTATLTLSSQWGMRTSGKLSLSNPEDAARAPSLLNAFFHGSAHSELRNPFLISAWVGTNAQLVMHLNSVSSGAVINVRVDGTSVFTKTIANKDGGYDVNNEYNQDFPLSLSPGKHLIEVRNSGSDWFYLDWVRLENILPSQYANGWQPSPIATGMQNPGEALVYVVNPAINFPVNATNSNVALVTNGFLQVTNWVRGNINALWYDPSTGQTIGKSVGISSNNILLVPLPSFKEDLSGRLVPELKVQQVIRTNSALDLYLTAPLPAHAEIQASNDLRNWNSIADLEFNDQIVEVPLDLSHHSIFRFKTAE